MVDHLRDERVRLAEQHQFLSHVLHVSPSGIVILDFDRRVAASTRPPSACWTGPARRWSAGARRARLAARQMRSRRSRPARRALVGLLGARRVKCHHGTFIDRGFPRSFLLIEELTEELRQFERAAYEKLIRVMSHEVNNTVAASNSLLHSSLAYAGELDAAQPPRLRAGDRHRHRADRAAEQLHAPVRRRLPPAAAADQPQRSGRRRSTASCGCSAPARAPPASPGAGSWTQPSVRGGRSIAGRSSRRC